MFFLRLGSSRTKNFRLMGTGVNPLLVYATGVGIVAFWVFGAYALSIFGPVVGFVVTAGIIAAGIYFPHRYHAIRAARLAAGCCTKCGYDLRASFDCCPECGSPIPEEIARRRRFLALIRAKNGPVNPASPPSGPS